MRAKTFAVKGLWVMHFLLPPVAVVLLALLMWGLDRYLPLVHWLQSPYHWAGLGLSVVGLGLANWHARLFKRLGTNINTFGEPGQLTRSGLFGRTRNPMYLGMLLALLGWLVWLGSVSPLCGPMVFFLMAQYWYIPVEEEAMTAKFGAEYMAYQRVVLTCPLPAYQLN